MKERYIYEVITVDLFNQRVDNGIFKYKSKNKKLNESVND